MRSGESHPQQELRIMRRQVAADDFEQGAEGTCSCSAYCGSEGAGRSWSTNASAVCVTMDEALLPRHRACR